MKHISSVSLTIITLGLYLLGDTVWVDPYLPENGKPLVLFMLVSITVVYELHTHGLKSISNRLDSISRDIEVNRLVSAVNGMYGRFISSGDEYIDNEYTIKELAEVTDMRERLGVNSYTKGRLKFLNSKVKRG